MENSIKDSKTTLYRNYSARTPLTLSEAQVLNKHYRELKEMVGCSINEMHRSVQSLMGENKGSTISPSRSSVTRLLAHRSYLTWITPVVQCACNIFGDANVRDVITMHSMTPRKEETYKVAIKTLLKLDKVSTTAIDSIVVNSAVCIIRFKDNTSQATVAGAYDAIASYLPGLLNHRCRTQYNNGIQTKKPICVLRTRWIEKAAAMLTRVLCGTDKGKGLANTEVAKSATAKGISKETAIVLAMVGENNDDEEM